MILRMFAIEQVIKMGKGTEIKEVCRLSEQMVTYIQDGLVGDNPILPGLFGSGELNVVE